MRKMFALPSTYRWMAPWKIRPGQYHNWVDEIAAFKYDELLSSDALLLGRVTYEGFAAAWPTMTDEQGFADRMNSLPKHVASTTLTEAAWNATIIKDDVVQAIAALKQQSGANILVYGSSQLVQTLLHHDLVDEYRLLVYPVVLGSGMRLFKHNHAKLKLVASQSFSSGVIALTYEPDRSQKAEPSADEQ